jgi:hypothetical protein
MNMETIPNEYPPLLSLSEATTMLGVSKEYLTKIRRAGIIDVYEMQGGTDSGRPKYKFYRDELKKHFGLNNER